jgi:hypothetical protein
VARFDLDGPGATFATTYTLRSDRVLESRRYSPSGGYDERRRLALDRPEYERYRSALRAGGYFGAERAAWQLLDEFEDSWDRSERVRD